MTKKRSKSLFVIFAIILVVCLIACFVNFTYPLSLGGNYYSYSNFVSNLKLGEDISNSVRIVYRAETNDTETATNYNNLRSATINDLKDIIKAEGFKDVTVTEHGEDGIVVQIGNILTEDDKNSVINLIGNPATISFSTNSNGDDAFATAKHVKSVNPMQYNNPETGEVSYLVVVEFKDAYKSEIKDASTDKTVYIHLGETTFAQLDYSGGAIEEGVIYLQSTTITSMLDATTCANQIKSGMLDLSLTQIECDMITPSYGSISNILLAVAMVLLVIAGFAFLIVKYRHAGWLACFNLLFFIVIGLFLLQSIPLVHINFAGIVAMLVCFIFALDAVLSVLEKAKMHYKNEIKLYVAFRESQKENLIKNIILHSLLLVVGFICIFIPVASIQSFGWVALVLSLVSAFTNLALMRLFIKMYLALNSEDGKKCNFHKGGKNA